ncbi:MAG: 50S ribosomal protein L29 [Chloroflexota bacterium]
MKPRKTKDLIELTDVELGQLLDESRETLAKQKFQHSLKQLNDTTYLHILRKDIARMETLINQRKSEI